MEVYTITSSQQPRILLAGVGSQAVNLILDMERIQRRATKFILSFAVLV